jgi:hypothetical protein
LDHPFVEVPRLSIARAVAKFPINTSVWLMSAPKTKKIVQYGISHVCFWFAMISEYDEKGVRSLGDEAKREQPV